MRKWLFTQKKQLNRGAIGSALSVLIYVVCTILKLPSIVGTAILVVGILVAVWTFLSMLLYPKDRKAEDVSYSALWGQCALIVLMVLMLI